LTKAVPEELRKQVVREHLKAKSRSEIARLIGLGTGTVTNIIQEWRQQVAGYEPEKITELAVELGKTGSKSISKSLIIISARSLILRALPVPTFKMCA
jgi:hypothetical protein